MKKLLWTFLCTANCQLPVHLDNCSNNQLLLMHYTYHRWEQKLIINGRWAVLKTLDSFIKWINKYLVRKREQLRKALWNVLSFIHWQIVLQIKTLKNKHLVVARKNEVSPPKRDVLMAGVRRVLIFLLFLTHFSGLIILINRW